jgi:uncharacterized membrane protein
VFAIAATLLILNVVATRAPLGRELLHIWPSYAGYAVSFLSIGIIWANHHSVFRQIGTVDRPFLMINVSFLMLVAFIPFPTRLVALHLRDQGAEAAALAYGITLTCTAVLYNALWLYAARHGRLLSPEADPRAVSGITRSFRPGPFIYGAATLVALVQPTVSVVLYGLVAAFYVIEASFFGGRANA